MSRRELFFVKEGEDLIPNGSQIKVIEYNRDIYCQKAGMKAIGAGVWRCLS